jgi:molybdopterin/thiamine biosynthesis adenylyltransferase
MAVIGQGSGGSVVADMLARYGVREITLVDPDRLTEENCKRHILTRDAVGENKAFAMAMHLSQITDADIYIQDNKFGEYDGPKGMDHFLKEPDVIACCADSDQCCQLVNAYALSRKIPVVYGAVHGDAHTAEIITVFPGITPCYACYEREGKLPEPTQEHYTDPNHDPTKMPHQEGLWCDILMAASIQFRAVLKVLQVKDSIAAANKSRRERGIIYGCFGELWADLNPLILASLRPPYGSQIIRQKRGCAVCTDNMEALRV